jgi:cell division protein FtsB
VSEHAHYEPNTFERWAVRGLIGILVTLVGWIGVRAINGQDQAASAMRDLSTQVAVMRTQMADLSVQVGDTHDMTKQIAVMQQTLQDHERRIELLEDRGSRPPR